MGELQEDALEEEQAVVMRGLKEHEAFVEAVNKQLVLSLALEAGGELGGLAHSSRRKSMHREEWSAKSSSHELGSSTCSSPSRATRSPGIGRSRCKVAKSKTKGSVKASEIASPEDNAMRRKARIAPRV